MRSVDLPSRPMLQLSVIEVLLTVLMTDIAGSTEQAVRIGDQAWREIIEAHDRAAGAAVARHGGTIIKSTGDGLLATFQGRSRAIVCARELQSETQSLEFWYELGSTLASACGVRTTCQALQSISAHGSWTKLQAARFGFRARFVIWLSARI